MWLGQNESAAYWMTVLIDMNARGMEGYPNHRYR